MSTLVGDPDEGPEYIVTEEEINALIAGATEMLEHSARWNEPLNPSPTWNRRTEK